MTVMKKIDSYTGIRFYWAITIILCHLYWIYDAFYYHGEFYFLKHGGFAVTGFFIMSGFLVSMHYADSFEEKGCIHQGFLFMCRHIKKWYLLYIISMIPALFFEIWNCKSIVNGCKLFGKLILNVFLVQTWIPKHEYSINKVAWFLSCLCAIYLFTPVIIKVNKKIREKKVYCVLVEVICFIAIYVLADYKGILYNHPFYRVFQYILGIVLYDLVKDSQVNGKKIWGYFAIAVQIIAYLHIFSEMSSTIDSFATVFFIAIFYFSVSNMFLSGKWILKLGTISTEIFLLHYPIVVFGGPMIIKLFPQNSAVFILEQIGFIFISVLVAYIYHEWFQNLGFMKKIGNVIKQKM